MDVIAGGKLTDNELLDKMVHELAERNGKYVPVRGVPGVVMYGNVAADGLRFLDQLYTQGFIYDEDWT